MLVNQVLGFSVMGGGIPIVNYLKQCSERGDSRQPLPYLDRFFDHREYPNVMKHVKMLSEKVL